MFAIRYVSCVMCHMSSVMCQMSHVICHMSRVMCHMSHVTKKKEKSGGASWLRVCYQRHFELIGRLQWAQSNYQAIEIKSKSIHAIIQNNHNCLQLYLAGRRGDWFVLAKKFRHFGQGGQLILTIAPFLGYS